MITAARIGNHFRFWLAFFWRIKHVTIVTDRATSRFIDIVDTNTREIDVAFRNTIANTFILGNNFTLRVPA
ncbi:Uncharacterised protein [Vibrio cholerae]|uniref:Uncharacterized protein n=1 Tax=Vibrio cholerae TaxID=666 RepID=A0A655ZMU2_VIBCL|nr:Uncharacterised protein [Vibrio cholerae]